jgi:glyoxylase-like metal-dependent hydrolase (beta-lactamase superfamily II)
MASLEQPPAAPPIAIATLPVLNDNYVFVLSRGGQAVVVDPAVAAPVIALLEQQQLELVAVLQTHHHQDHIGGTAVPLATGSGGGSGGRSAAHSVADPGGRRW